MHNFLTTGTTRPNENFVFMGNRVKIPVEAVRTYYLIFDTAHHLGLFETLYVPNFSSNLVYLAKLDVTRSLNLVTNVLISINILI